MFGHGGDDVLQAGGGENSLFGGSGADKFVIEAVDQNTVIFGDHARILSDGTDVELDGNGNLITSNESYGDLVFFDFTWPLVNSDGSKDPDSYIQQLGNNHFKVHHKLGDGEEINVELYDVEGAYFSDGDGGLEYHALTTGRPITKDDFGSLSYEAQKVKFWVEHNDLEFGGATSISVVTTTRKSFTDPDTKQLVYYEDPTVKWKGLATEADSFVFNDVTVNVVNVSQTDITGAPIVDTTVYGTSGMDLIIGDEFDNLIYAGDDNDIIFAGDGEDEVYGEGGDDVLIGADGDDLLYGDYKYDIVLNPEELDGNDVIIGGAGIDKIDSGEGQNVVASGDLSAVILNTELGNFNTFIDYDEDDLPV
jgi:Ca2+-binding RTX toxin-like protein